MSAVVTQEPDDALLTLQIGHVHVEVHAIDAFHFQGDVVAEDFRDGAWYTHEGLRSSWSLRDPPTAQRFEWGCASIPRFGSTGALLFTSRRSEAEPR